MRTQQDVARQIERYQQALQRTSRQIQEVTCCEDFQELLRLRNEHDQLTGGLHALEWALSSDTDERYIYPWVFDWHDKD